MLTLACMHNFILGRWPMAWKDGGAWFGKLVVHGLESWWFMAWKDDMA